ncbi:MAG: FAD:protein FMN transferase [Oscillospiraceae bacterium]|nr:FAD:protein FMN transferase [Oscillospiraceae bacterium]
MRRVRCLLLAAVLLLTGCAVQVQEPSLTRYEASFLSLFDTVTTMVGFASSEDEFRAVAQQIHDDLEEYHQLYDIYHDYPGINNLKTVNDMAGAAPVQVDRRIVDLLLLCKDMEQETGGMVNVAMGSVLQLWHEARMDALADPAHARLPDQQLLQQAAEHTDLDKVIVDEEHSTVFLSDPQMRLDVGAVAKGYAVRQVCSNAPKGLLISVGGNVCSTGEKPDGTPWVVGLENPDGGNYLHTIYHTIGAVVTSGDYQRYFIADGKAYHHIIDPDTLMPGTNWRAVSILCEDSALADALSTALFLLPRAEGQKLLDRFEASAMWVALDGSEYFSPGFEERLKT